MRYNIMMIMMITMIVIIHYIVGWITSHIGYRIHTKVIGDEANSIARWLCTLSLRAWGRRKMNRNFTFFRSEFRYTIHTSHMTINFDDWPTSDWVHNENTDNYTHTDSHSSRIEKRESPAANREKYTFISIFFFRNLLIPFSKFTLRSHTHTHWHWFHFIIYLLSDWCQ